MSSTCPRVDVSDYEIYEVATSDGVKRLRYPRLDGPKVTSLPSSLPMFATARLPR